MTLVELVVAMALTALFAGACIMLILPIESIYTRMTDTSRAQLVADTVITSLRDECANSYITGTGDVWISDDGFVLTFRKQPNYCETIFSNEQIDPSYYLSLKGDSSLSDGEIIDRAIFRLFSGDDADSLISTIDTEAGYVHFGYFESTGGTTTNVSPNECFDFTNPFPCATYREFKTDLIFTEIGYDTNNNPSWVICNVNIMKGSEVVYTRETVLCFAAPKTANNV